MTPIRLSLVLDCVATKTTPQCQWQDTPVSREVELPVFSQVAQINDKQDQGWDHIGCGHNSPWQVGQRQWGTSASPWGSFCCEVSTVLSSRNVKNPIQAQENWDNLYWEDGPAKLQFSVVILNKLPQTEFSRGAGQLFPEPFYVPIPQRLHNTRAVTSPVRATDRVKWASSCLLDEGPVTPTV